MHKKTSEKGQILLIVVITMIVALTVGLSVASRTITELRLSRQSEESQRAFNAAEAGIDRVLQQGEEVTIQEDLGNNASFVVTASAYDGSQIILNNGEQVDQGVGADVWLSNYPDFSNQIADARLTIYWGEPSQTDCAAGESNIRPGLQIVLLQGDINNPSLSKYLYDTCSGRTSGSLDGSSFGNYTVDGIPGEVFLNRIDLPIQVAGGIIMKVIPTFNSTKVAVVAESSIGNPVPLPSQGYVVESTGTSGETLRRIIYYQSFPQMPIEVFPYNILSQ